MLVRRAALMNTLTLLVLLLTGCQGALAPVEDWQASAVNVPQAGLQSAKQIDVIAATVAPPVGWQRRPTQEKPFAKHVQFRSGDETVRMGVVKFALPWPLSPEALVWMGRQRYKNSEKKAYELADTWRDDLGRLWVLGKTSKWDARGYLVTRGFSGWLVYRSHRTDIAVDPTSLEAANAAVDAVVPDL